MLLLEGRKGQSLCDLFVLRGEEPPFSPQRSPRPQRRDSEGSASPFALFFRDFVVKLGLVEHDDQRCTVNLLVGSPLPEMRTKVSALPSITPSLHHSINPNARRAAASSIPEAMMRCSASFSPCSIPRATPISMPSARPSARPSASFPFMWVRSLRTASQNRSCATSSCGEKALSWEMFKDQIAPRIKETNHVPTIPDRGESANERAL